ncbi:ATP-dependent DNA helicase [Ideonella sp. DXS22W]|uniref:ATP-dependent DNA helicase n=1 Tax=Pseudaquabacterium inlustre TaxID=2984192 RepID=A0ABU9CHC8_9BURK
MNAPLPPPATDAPYSVAVRTLCEFTAKQGDLDRRFTPSATALEGLLGQGLVAQRRGPDYETEIALEATLGPLRVRGRADGYDPRRRCLEEIKTLRGPPDEIPANRRRLHWAQLQTYGALFCRARGVDEIALSLVYFDIASQTETELRQVYGAAELETLLAQRCQAFSAWARQELAHRAARDAALAGLAFPEPAFRPGQRDLAAAVYRTARQRHRLLAQAPTGIGKTVGTLYPLLRAMPAERIDKIAFLTCKNTGRLAALEALHNLRGTPSAGAPAPLRVQLMLAKEEACVHPDKACHGDACPLARGFYDRLPAARAQAVAQAWLDGPALRAVAAQHQLCPYYLGQELLRWADVLVGDVHHLFDPHGQLPGLAQALDWQLAVLVDEAHNLVERTRRMYSAQLRLRQIDTALRSAPPAVAPALAGLRRAAAQLLGEAGPPEGTVLGRVPEGFAQALQTATGALAEHFQQQPLSVGTLLDFFFELQRLQRLVDTLGEHSLFELQASPPTPTLPDDAPLAALPADGDGVLAVHNVVPAPFLRPRWAALHSATLFSATLAPPDFARQLLGLPDDTGWIDVPPAFPPEHLCVQVADGLSTRYAHRRRSLQALVDTMARQFDAHPGNYLAFFSSFDYLAQAAAQLARQRPDIPQWCQQRRMPEEARLAFLARFAPQGRGIGFAVLGGVFAEGVDLPGPLLIGAFIATLGLPPVSPLQTHLRERLDALFGPGHGYADRVPALQRVVQAAGRVLRTPDDRGWLWLLDQRYRAPEVTALLPAWWGLADAATHPAA